MLLLLHLCGWLDMMYNYLNFRNLLYVLYCNNLLDIVLLMLVDMQFCIQQIHLHSNLSDIHYLMHYLDNYLDIQCNYLYFHSTRYVHLYMFRPRKLMLLNFLLLLSIFQLLPIYNIDFQLSLRLHLYIRSDKKYILMLLLYYMFRLHIVT